MALIKKLENIGNAIREKTGKTDLLTLEQMVTEIEAIETGGGSAELPEEAYKITGRCDYRFANNGWNWFIENYGNKITTEDIDAAGYMFYDSDKLEEIPFNLNFKETSQINFNHMFNNCHALEKIGKIIGMYPNNLSSMFSACYRLRELPEFVDLNMERMYTYTYAAMSNMFQNCYSLRSISEDLLKQLYIAVGTSVYYLPYSNMFYNCYALDEIRGLNPQTGILTSNVFQNTFNNCGRLKEIIFATQEDGTPYSVNWKFQTIDLTNSSLGHGRPVGSIYGSDWVTGYNSGITSDKYVWNDETYQALKDDPDWFAGSPNYSRYNHDSAVNTINSLPDTSTYLATAGGTNTIKFLGAAGSLTDGGAINTLTEEEIAVATAKGWTVTLV